MSEQPAQYNDRPVPPTLSARVDTVERQISLIIDAQSKNTNAIAGLINAVDGLRASIDTRMATFDARMTAMEKQLVALNESNRLLIDLITSRLPVPPKE